MATMAENQARIEALLFDAQVQKGKLDQAAATVGTAKNRMESLASMLENARVVLQYPTQDEDLAAAREVAREEARYWLRAYVDALPKLCLARDTMVGLQKELDRVQEEYRAQMVEADAVKATRLQGAVGNPPGASPSADFRA